jgi:hypothetical protein
LVLDVLFGEFSVYGQQKEANNEKQQFWNLRSTFNSSLGKYFNSIFLSTVMTLFKHFEIDPLLKKTG